jgi:hypothetical protein
MKNLMYKGIIKKRREKKETGIQRGIKRRKRDILKER